MDFTNILKPKIIDDKLEGKHAIIHMKDMRSFLNIIDELDYYYERDRDSKWQFGEHVDTKEALLSHLKKGQTSKPMIRRYHKLRASINGKFDVSKFAGSGISCKRKRVRREDGDDLSMSRLMAGSDNYWTTVERKSKRANVRIGMNMAIAFGHKERDFALLGATLATICDVITKLGYSCEVFAYNFCRYEGSKSWKYFGLSIPIKKPNEPLDIHRLMSAGLPGLFRFLMFGIMDKKYGFDGSMGRQTQTSDCYKRELNVIHTVEQKFCKAEEHALDGLDKALKNIAQKPSWFN